MWNAIGLQAVHLMLLAGLYLLVGLAIALFSAARWGQRWRIEHAFLVGFAAAPLALGVVAFAFRVSLGVAFIVVAGGALASIIWLIPRRGAARPPHALDSQTCRPDGSLVREAADPWIWPIAAVGALLINGSYLLWALSVKGGQGIYWGTSVFDAEKHLGVLAALLKYGLPAQHPWAPGVPLTYYTGFYVCPAATANLLPASVPQAWCAQLLLGTVVWFVVASLWLRRLGLSPLWRLLALTPLVAGTSLGFEYLGWVPAIEGSAFLRQFYRAPNHLELLPWLFLWVPQHLSAISLAGYISPLLPQLPRVRHSDLVLLSLGSAYVISSSTMVGILYGGVLALYLLLPSPSAGQPTRAGLRPLGLSLLASLALCLPHYWTSIGGAMRGGGHVGAVLALTDNMAHNVGFLFSSCGLALPLSLFLVRLRMPLGLRPLYLLGVGSAAAALLSNYVSEMLHKSLYVAQAVFPLTAVALSVALQREPVHWKRMLGAILGLVLGMNALVSLFYGIHRVRGTVAALPQVSSHHYALVQWILRHTRPGDFVGILDPSGISSHYTLCRTTATSGQALFPRLSDRWGNRVAIGGYQRRNGGVLATIGMTDYVVVYKAPVSLGVYSYSPQAPEEARRFLLDSGFRVVFENPAGLVARRPDRVRVLTGWPDVSLVGLTEARRNIEDGDFLAALRILEGADFQWKDYECERSYLLALALHVVGRDANKAAELYAKALQCGFDPHRRWPNFGNVLLKQARRHIDQGNLAEALRILDSAFLESEDPKGERSYLLAFTLHSLGRDPAKALGLYTRALERGFDPFWVLYNRGALFLALGDKASARRDLGRAQQLNPAHEGPRTYLNQLGR